MHGIVRPPSTELGPAPDRLDAVKRKLYEYRFLLLLVVLPTLIVATYYYAFASDQYETEADFVVRSQVSKPSPTGIGSLISIGGASSLVSPDADSVIDYLKSTEAALHIERSTGLANRFTRSWIDPWSRLTANPSPEELRSYYNNQVEFKLDKETGITKVTVHAFVPADSYAIADSLLKLGELRVNEMNKRSNSDALTGTGRQLTEAEDALRDVQVKMTAFRRTQSDIDPEASGRAQMAMVSGMTTTLSAARAQLAAMHGIISPSSPQYIAMSRKVRALESEVSQQGGKLVGQGGSIASSLGDYESLRVRQEFAEKRYEFAAGAYQTAREEARRKQIYLVRVVNPNMPVKALFPERGKIVLTVFCSLLIAYGIGWLLISGVREHANG